MWNPEKIKQHQFTTKRKESCTAQINVRIPPSLKARLKNIDNWHESVRSHLEELVDRAEKK